MTEWKDTSSFSRSDRDRTPNCYTITTTSIRLELHRHIDYPGRWCWSMSALGGELARAKLVPLDDVLEAQRWVRTEAGLLLARLARELNGAV